MSGLVRTHVLHECNRIMLEIKCLLMTRLMTSKSTTSLSQSTKTFYFPIRVTTATIINLHCATVIHDPHNLSTQTINLEVKAHWLTSRFPVVYDNISKCHTFWEFVLVMWLSLFFRSAISSDTVFVNSFTFFSSCCWRRTRGLAKHNWKQHIEMNVNSSTTYSYANT